MSGARWQQSLRARQAETKARRLKQRAKPRSTPKRRPPKSLREKLRRDTQRTDEGCLLWLGQVDRHGYGRVQHGGRKWRLHRLAWTLERGPIPIGAVVRHRCDVPRCCAIGHLEVGTQAENLQDRDRQGRGMVPIRKLGKWTGEVRSNRIRRSVRRRADANPMPNRTLGPNRPNRKPAK